MNYLNYENYVNYLNRHFFLKLFLAIVVLLILSLIIVTLADTDRINIKNSDRRKIKEKYEKNDEYGYLKKKNNQLRNFGKRISKKLRIDKINKSK